MLLGTFYKCFLRVEINKYSQLLWSPSYIDMLNIPGAVVPYVDMLLFQVLWSLMLNYHHIIKWHEQYDPAMHVSEAEQDEPSAEATYNKNYIQQKLEHGLNRIWKVIIGS